jgi:hypothetical protein
MNIAFRNKNQGVVACLLTVLVLLMSSPLYAWKHGINSPKQVDRFYALNNQQPFWFTPNPFSAMIRARFMEVLDSVGQRALDKERYHYSDLKAVHIEGADSSAKLAEADRMFTDALLTYGRDLYQGGNITGVLSNDEVTGKYGGTDDDFLAQKLLSVTTVPAVDNYLTAIEFKHPDVTILENALLANPKGAKADQLRTTLNLYRWMKHYKFDKYIVVNIPAATLRLYEGDEMKLEMKVVVGKPETKTPRFSSFCKEVILYPYWNVPPSITSKELLPKFKKNPEAFETMNMQIVDKRGHVVDRGSVNLERYSGGDFPYTFRQYTGCDNALGVIKFNLTDPFDVYLHDTNNKLAFKKDARFLSHGCIRVEKPIDLANALLSNEVDEGLIRACVKGQEPITKRVAKPVPVFVLYMTADVHDGKIKYYKDIYGIL